MSLAILEFNDHELGLYDQSGLVISSPGYVLVHGRQPVFGHDAATQSRLHPVSTNNEFWHRLGMTPLPRPLAHFRHHADIAHGHLMHLAQESAYAGDVVLSVPASFSREQLAVLTGVIRHTPFRPVAMVDAALSSLLAIPGLGRVVYVDLQLHQLCLTRLIAQDGYVRRDAFVVIPGTGWTHLANTIVQAATDAFVAQARFNPQHSAVWEQALYNELPAWLQQFKAGQQEVLAQIQTEKNIMQARLSLSDVLEALEPALHKMTQHLEQFMLAEQDGAMVDTVLSARAALIPGLQECMQASAHSLPGEQLAALGLQSLPLDLVDGTGRSSDTVPLLGALALTPPSARREAADAATADHSSVTQRQPTHLLWQGQAWPLPLSVSVDAQGNPVFSRPPDDGGTSFNIDTDGMHARLTADRPGISVCGKPVSGSQMVFVGNNIRVLSSSIEFYLIRVHG